MVWPALVVLGVLHWYYTSYSSLVTMAGPMTSKERASFSVDPGTLSADRKKYLITRNLEVRDNVILLYRGMCNAFDVV